MEEDGGGTANQSDDVVDIDLPPAVMQELREAFITMDTDGSGELTLDEMMDMIRAMGQNPTDQETLDLMREVDEDGNGSMDFEEFSSLMAIKLKHFTASNEIHKALKVFDVLLEQPLGRGKIPSGKSKAEDFVQMLCSLGMSEEEATEVLVWAKPDKDGMIDYNKFANTLEEDPEVVFGAAADHRRSRARNGRNTIFSFINEQSP